MAKMLYKIPCNVWVSDTIRKMIDSKVNDSSSWLRNWSDTYYQLGGKSASVAKKGCPSTAAFGLWNLGRIVGGEKRFRHISVIKADVEFGKNTAYALIAVGMFEQGWISRSQNEIWQEVRRQYKFDTGKMAASSDQGAAKLARILFEEGMII